MKKRKSPISRRKFLFRGVGAAALALAAVVTESAAATKPSSKKKSAPSPPPAAPAPNPEEPPVQMSTVDLNLTVNGKKIKLSVPAGKTLAEVLRQDLGLTGVKIGCASAECGSCTVLVNSRPIYSCMLLAALADQAVVETIEGVTPSDGRLHPIQQAFVEKDALQCGFCTPGMICSTKALLVRNPRPTDAEIREGLSGNLCRCGAYEAIVKAVLSAAESRG